MPLSRGAEVMKPDPTRNRKSGFSFLGMRRPARAISPPPVQENGNSAPAARYVLARAITSALADVQSEVSHAGRGTQSSRT